MKMKLVALLVFLFIVIHSGLSQTGPGGIQQTNGSSDLVLWLDANTINQNNATNVSSWTDLSGSGNTANAVGGREPVFRTNVKNGFPAVRFTASNTDYLRVDDDASLKPNDISVIVVGSYTNNSPDYAPFLIKTNNYSEWSAGYGIVRDDGEEAILGFVTNWDENFVDSNLDYDTPTIMSLVYDRTDVRTYYDEDLQGTDGFTSNVTHTTNFLYLGISPDGNSGTGTGVQNPLDGDIYEVIIIGRDLNDAERIIISNYLSAKYAVALAANDVYNEDDNGNFDFDVAGIGIEANGSQTDSQGTGWVRINSASGMTSNGEYLMWGHDDAVLSTNSDISDALGNRANRVWRVSETGDVGTVTLTMDCSEFIIGDTEDLKLLVDNNTTFSTGATEYDFTTYGSFDYATNKVTFTGVDFSDNDYFTLGSSTSQNALGGIYYSIGDADYTSITNWRLNDRNQGTTGGTPFSAPTISQAVITNGTTVDIDDDSGIQNVKIENGGTLRFDGNFTFEIAEGGSLTIEDGGLLTASGAGTGNSPRLEIDGTSDVTLQFGGTGDRITVLRRIQVRNTGETTFKGTGDISLGDRLVLNGNCTFNNALDGTLSTPLVVFTQSNAVLNNNTDATINITSEIIYSSSSDGSTLNNDGTVSITDDIRYNAGGTDNIINNNSTGEFTVSGDFNLQNEVLVINNTGDFTHMGSFNNVGGSEIFNNLNGGTWTSSAPNHTGVTMNCSASGNTFIYDLAGTQEVFIPFDGAYHRLIVQSSGTKTPLGSLDVNGDLTIDGTATLDVSTNTADINVGGDWTNNSTFTTGTQTVIFDGASAQSISDGSYPATFYNLTFQGSGTKTPGGDLDVNNDLTIGGSATLAMAANSIALGGDWNNTGGTFNEGTGTVAFDNTSAGQSISTTAADETFNNIDISNSGQIVTMNDDVNISNTLEFTTAGYIDINSNDLLITDWDDNDIVGLGTNLDRFVIVDQAGTFGATGVGTGETVNLPIGLAAGSTNYARADILNNDVEASFSAAVCGYSDEKGGCSGSDPISGKIVNYTWNLSSTSTAATVTLYWDASKELSFDRNDVFMARFGSWPAGDGNHWDNLGSSGVASNLVGDVWSFSGTTDHFSFFGVGSGDSVLPIELIGFKALKDDDALDILWTTATEIDNDFFTIERSINGVDWSVLTTVEGAGNSTSQIDYQSTDKSPIYGESYYRLKQTDYDGKFTYSPIVYVNFGDIQTTVTVYPNPTRNEVNIYGSAEELSVLKIYNALGLDLTESTQILESNNSKTVMDISGLKAGLYYIKTKTTSQKIYKR
jgi:hypothetical protein